MTGTPTARPMTRRKAAIASLVASAAVMLVLISASRLSRERVTPASVGRVRIGMSDAELLALLGEPGFEEQQLGKVLSPTVYATDVHYTPDELRQKGYRDYVWRQWTSPEAGIAVVSDTAGRVVFLTRYDVSPSRPRSFWLDWLRRLF